MAMNRRLLRWRIFAPLLVILATATPFVAPYVLDPYVRVPGQFIDIAISCTPSTITLVLADSAPPPVRHSLRVADPNATSDSIRSVPTTLDSAGNVTLLIPAELQDQVTTQISQGHTVSVRLEYSKVASISIRNILFTDSERRGQSPRCPNSVAGEELRTAILAPDPTLMRYAPAQERLSSAVLVIHEKLAGPVVLGMLAYLVWHLSGLARLIFWRRFYSDSSLLKQVEANFSESPSLVQKEGREHFVVYQYTKGERQLALARVVGPTLGFILTVASLIAGLHPAVSSERDPYELISALQIALVATLLGLLIRLAAEYSIAASRELAEKKLLLIKKAAIREVESTH